MPRKPKSQTNTVENENINNDPLNGVKKSNRNLKSIQPISPRPLPRGWNSSLVLSKIFKHMKFKDLLNISTVCRQWNELINPRIYQSLKLTRFQYMKNKYHGDIRDDSLLRTMEIQACMDNNSKYTHFVKQIKMKTSIDESIAKDWFSTFCHLTKLHFFNFTVSEDLVLRCLRPLTQLICLRFEQIIINPKVRDKFEFELVQLPSTLIQLEMIHVQSYSQSTLFIQTLVSHTNIDEFTFDECFENEFINRFTTHYPTLKKLTVTEGFGSSLKDKMINIIKVNPQLTELHYKSDNTEPNMVQLINHTLTDLRALTLNATHKSNQKNYIQVQWMKSMNLDSLTLYSNEFSVDTIISILKQIPNLKILNLPITRGYDRLTSIIRQKYPSLTELTYYRFPPLSTRAQQDSFKDFFINELYNSEYKCFKNLESFNFGHLDIYQLQPNHLERFPNLKLVRFIHPIRLDSSSPIIKQIETHLKKFKGWRSKIDTTKEYLSGYLYKRQVKYPVDLMEPFLTDRVITTYLTYDEYMSHLFD